MNTNPAVPVFKKVVMLVVLGVSLLQIGCTGGPRSRPANEQWVELTALVDGVIEIQISVPKPYADNWPTKLQFVGSETNRLTRIFKAGYDRGYGGLSGADMVSFYGAILRIEKLDGQTSPITYEEVLQIAYKFDKEDRKFNGEELIGNDKWYRVDYMGENPLNGSAYYRLLSDKYALLVSMRAYGEDSDKTLLYRQRHQDLMKALASIKVTIADFADQ